jgi:hypothetical protein
LREKTAGKNKKSTEYGLIFLFAVVWYAYIHTNKGVTMKTAERLLRRRAAPMEALSGMEGMVRGSLVEASPFFARKTG